MKRGMGKRITAVVTSLALLSTTLSNLTLGQKVQAAEQAKAVNLGVSQIAAPSAPQEGKSWDGDCVYYGTYQNQPMKWRVLDPTGKAGISSATGGILLQSDQVLDNMAYADVQTWLETFKTDNFSGGEQAGIMTTAGEAGTSPVDFLKSTGLAGNDVFLLDVADLANASYGYEYKDEAVNSGIKGSWWLRSIYPDETYADLIAGSVLSSGELDPSFTLMKKGVVPAFNLDASKVLFVTAASGKKNALQAVEPVETKEWKLTLSEGATLQADQAKKNAENITIPYKYTGNATAPSMSVMITSGDYQAGEIRYYGTVSAQNGNATFTLPEDFDEEKDAVYLIAEQINGDKQTDYASEPVKVEIPRHEHKWEWHYDGQAHWKWCAADDCPVENVYENDGADDGTGIDDDADDDEDADDDDEDEGDGDDEDDWAVEFFQWGEHDYGENEPRLNANGEKEILCNVCGQYIPQVEEKPDDPDEGDDEEEEPHEHKWSTEGIVIQEATCTESGIMRYYCTEYYEDGYKEDVEDASDEEDEAAQDDSDGDDVEDDDAEYYDTEIPPLSPTLTHTFGEWVTEKEPTTETEGVSRHTCSVCGFSETKPIDKLPPVHEHEYNILKSDETHHWYECEIDGEKDELEKHKWNKGKVLVKPTKDLEGEIQYTCTVCDVTVKRTMAKLGTEFSSGIYQYRVTAGKNGAPYAILKGFVKGKSAKTVNVEKTVTLQDVKYSVTKIGKKAFFRNKKIQKVVIGNHIEEIGNLAFFANKKLKSVTIGTGMKKLGQHTFCRAKKLKSFVVKSKKLQKIDLSIMHKNKKDIVIKVPAGKVKEYRKNIFFTMEDCVKALKKKNAKKKNTKK